MVEESVEVKLVDGLVARASAIFVQEANRYVSDIFLEKDEYRINAKSIMGLMSLSIAPGDEITIIADGPDELIALSHLVSFVSKETV